MASYHKQRSRLMERLFLYFHHFLPELTVSIYSISDVK
ncbi:hypothetical protein B4168_3897 [Anoxybacillus flavithermus]|nr:hypothetical protein B4168_3897 [Anoxybacillus flavithermus]OAO87918.1 hypothetical protein GT23_0651 [Parageobacillus thermoglucosidasius]